MLGVQFDDRHSYQDWGLRWYDLSISLPEYKSHTVEIPGRNGVIDLTEALTGQVCYNNREIVMGFDREAKTHEEWQRVITEVSRYLHGQRRKIVFDTDRGFYYIGRLKVTSSKTEYLTADFTVTADVEPFKYQATPTIISIPTSGQSAMILHNSRMPVSPSITTTAAYTLDYNGIDYSIEEAGTYTIPGLLLKEGDNLLTVTGNGTITFEYQEGEL